MKKINRENHLTFVRYLLSGIATALYYFGFLKLWFTLGFTINFFPLFFAFFSAVSLNYFVHSVYTFRTKLDFKLRFPKFIVISILLSVVSSKTILFLANTGMAMFNAQLLSFMVTIPLNFICQRIFVFNSKS